MKNLFSVNHATTTTDIAILLLRVGIPSIMLSHGVPKLISLLSGNVQFPAVFGLSVEVSLALTVFAEVFCSLFIIAGVGTRLATIPLIITMLVAVFMIHAADPFAKQELAVLYMLSFIVLFITGSGKYSLDFIIQGKNLRLSNKRIVEHSIV